MPQANPPYQSRLSRLQADLEEVLSQTEALISNSGIDFVSRRAERMADETGLMVLSMSDGKWKKLADAQRPVQRSILEKWQPWLEQTLLLFEGGAPDQMKTVQAAGASVASWINRDGGEAHRIPPTPAEACQVLREMAQPLVDALASLDQSDPSLLAVPDTNVLLDEPDLAAYADALGREAYTVLLVPGVLGEIDKHKTNHANPDIREKARAISRRIKGWRNQGNLAEGVRVQGDVWVKVIGKEPDLSRSLSWLTPEVVDDRIVASVLEVERQRPSDHVVLMTGDVLMLAKADAARIPSVGLRD